MATTTHAAQEAAAYAEALKRSLAETLEGLAEDEEEDDEEDDDAEGGVGARASSAATQHHNQYAPLPPADELVAAVEAALAGGTQQDDEEVAAAHACVRAALRAGSAGGIGSGLGGARQQQPQQKQQQHHRQPRDFAPELDARRRAAELASVQDYVGESDALVRLHGRIRACDSLLEDAERRLEAYERSIGACAGELRALQAQSAAMAGRLRGRREAEERLGKFVEHLAVPEELVRGIVGGGAGAFGAAAAAAAANNNTNFSTTTRRRPLILPEQRVVPAWQPPLPGTDHPGAGAAGVGAPVAFSADAVATFDGRCAAGVAASLGRPDGGRGLGTDAAVVRERAAAVRPIVPL